MYYIGSLSGGMKDIIDHPWFTKANFDWKSLLEKKIQAPYVPKMKSTFDTSHFDKYPERNVIRKYTGPDYFEGF